MRRIIVMLICLIGSLLMVGCSIDEESSETIQDSEAASYIIEPALTGIYGENFSIDIPSDISDKNGPFKGKDELVYESEDGSVKYILTPDKDEQANIMSYGWSIVINNESGGNEFRYRFDPTLDFKVISRKEGETDKINGEIAFIDSNDQEINTLSEPHAHDADGKEIETTYYTIDGKDVVQTISLEDVAFPITIE